MANDIIAFEIKEHIADLGVLPTGWTKELNIVSWNGNRDKYDIRDWDSTHERMSRGITLTEDEAKKVDGRTYKSLFQVR